MENKKCEVCGKEFKNLGAHMKAHEEKEKEKEIEFVQDSVVPVEVSISNKLNTVINGINTLAGAISKLVEMQSVKKEEVKEEKFIPKMEDETYPDSYMPKKYREIVDTVLSTEFDARIIDFTDRTEFQLDIFVPDRFSSLSKEDREKKIKDIRTRIIPRALGENGVREWCQLIRNNLTKYYQKKGIAVPFTEKAFSIQK